MIHPNSHEAHNSGQPEFNLREKMIVNAIRSGGPGSDASIAERLGFTHPQAVRPRITTLKQRGVLKEVGTEKSPITGKANRIVDLA